MAKINEVPDFEAMFNQIREQAPRFAAEEAVKFFKSSFANEGFTDAALVKWDKRKYDNRPGGAILTLSGDLRDSIRPTKITPKQVILSNAAPYAKIHNEGGRFKRTFTPTAKQKKMFWALYKKTGDTKFKAAALSKQITQNVVVPQRQFMGDSQTLTNSFDNWMAEQIVKAVKTL